MSTRTGKTWIAFWSILKKDMKTYYLKPPNISWGIIFPFAWTLMFFIRSGSEIGEIISIIPGVIALSILFGTTSMLAVTVTFEKKGRSFDRLLLSPMPLEVLMIAKTGGAALFGILNAFVPIVMASFFTDLSGVAWGSLALVIPLIALSSTFLGLFIAVSVSEVFEAQTFSNFFRFPMVFLCGLFFPVADLPSFLRPLSFLLPLTYGADVLHGAVKGTAERPLYLNLLLLLLFCLLLFGISLRNIRRKWIL
jgi:ABC-2 type transport system permease protein